MRQWCHLSTCTSVAYWYCVCVYGSVILNCINAFYQPWLSKFVNLKSQRSMSIHFIYHHVHTVFSVTSRILIPIPFELLIRLTSASFMLISGPIYDCSNWLYHAFNWHVSTVVGVCLQAERRIQKGKEDDLVLLEDISEEGILRCLKVIRESCTTLLFGVARNLIPTTIVIEN